MAPGILSTTFLVPYGSPERYNITDSHLPVLVYRSCLPSNPTTLGVTSFLEPNRWINSGAVNLPTTPHQCLAVLKGYNRLLLGKGPFQQETYGGVTAGTGSLAVDLYERDVLVLPAGVLQHSVLSHGSYEHIVFYPKEDKNPGFHEATAEEDQTAHVKQVLLPDRDPIFGVNGPLVEIWREAEEAWLKMAGL